MPFALTCKCQKIRILVKLIFLSSAKVPAGWPKIEPPPFSVAKNGTTINFIQLVKELGSGIIVVPFVSILGNVAIAKAFGKVKKRV